MSFNSSEKDSERPKITRKRQVNKNKWKSSENRKKYAVVMHTRVCGARNSLHVTLEIPVLVLQSVSRCCGGSVLLTYSEITWQQGVMMHRLLILHHVLTIQNVRGA